MLNISDFILRNIADVSLVFAKFIYLSETDLSFKF